MLWEGNAGFGLSPFERRRLLRNWVTTFLIVFAGFLLLFLLVLQPA